MILYYYIEINSYKTNHNFNDSTYNMYVKYERFKVDYSIENKAS